jgi:hypothetical protein
MPAGPGGTQMQIGECSSNGRFFQICQHIRGMLSSSKGNNTVAEGVAIRIMPFHQLGLLVV